MPRNSASAKRPEARDALRQLLLARHSDNATAPLSQPTDGVFCSAFFAPPRTAVLDANWLGADVAYACRNNQRTSLITAANERLLRILCARHVVDELPERDTVWSGAGHPEVSEEAF